MSKFKKYRKAAPELKSMNLTTEASKLIGKTFGDL
jgi:hypothetical protein